MCIILIKTETHLQPGTYSFGLHLPDNFKCLLNRKHKCKLYFICICICQVEKLLQTYHNSQSGCHLILQWCVSHHCWWSLWDPVLLHNVRMVPQSVPHCWRTSIRSQFRGDQSWHGMVWAQLPPRRLQLHQRCCCCKLAHLCKYKIDR